LNSRIGDYQTSALDLCVICYGLKRLRGNELLNIADYTIAGPKVAPALPREETQVSL
jgi:hypothetical protein